MIELPGGALVAVGARGSVLRSNDRGRHWDEVARGKTPNDLQHVIVTQDKAPGGAPKVVVCTSRQPVELSGGRKITLQPEPLAPEVPGITTAALVGRAATIIARAELGDDFRPKRVNDAIVQQALMADPNIQASKVDFIERFVQNGLLSRRIIGFESSVEYLLDPLAECLAA